MSTVKKADGDEILYLDEIHDEVSRPLTSNDVEAVPAVHSIPAIGLRAGFSTEADEDKSVSKSEIDDGNDENLNGQPLSAIGFNRSLAETESHPDWPNNAFPPAPSTVQLATPDVNVYQHKKTLAQGMMDLALLSANANQMRYVLQTDGRHPYFYPSLVMISMSLFLQIAVGIGLIWNSVYNVKKHEQMCKANKANNWTVIGIFLVTILNVFISSFGVVDQIQPSVTT
ncbi:hypothetical protein DMN91_006862 [Ooceraea biroi]|uniref:Ninjurin-1 n=1 Tax=Ooceraea biroi TaxID=2015173 RepID=A0A026W625_OOCBI|nr:ninjurin-2 [Ooceraea biroi]EZA51458.1 Ninjurin-1 [Ooceraea biroi]RLU20255.1 hypothetical protein DMN91_006862 [Ooceraea biroi]